MNVQCIKCGRRKNELHQCPKTAADNLAKAFQDRYVPVTESGCWLWIGRYQSAGYGFMPLGARGLFKLAHRVSWELHNGPIPDGMCVLHRCDVPACVNPGHLFIGDKRDNIIDARKKGRHTNTWDPEHVVGVGNFKAKLNEGHVRAIRRIASKFPRSYPRIAKRFHITATTVCSIVNRKLWRHVV